MSDVHGGFIQIKSSKFPVLPGEKEELVNDGMYGKALALYLQNRLTNLNYNVPFVCCEDWGWWVELRTAPFVFGVCVYSDSLDGSPVDFVCTSGTLKPRVWSWKQFRYVETSSWVKQLHEDLMAIFKADPDVEIVGTFAEFPL